MIRSVILILLFPICVYGQLSKQEKTKLYSLAITEYIKSVNATDKLILDTFFVGPINNELDESIHNVELPKEILKTKISKLSEEEGRRKVEYHKNFVFANVIGTFSKDHAQFIFVTFMVEKGPARTDWLPKHNYIVDLNYDVQTKAYKLEKQRFEYQYSNKYPK
jgi:hypothetical protein